MTFHANVLGIDAKQVTREIAQTLSRQVLQTLRRKGLVVGLSGGIDSSVVTGLAVEALGPERVLVVLMPEVDSSPASMELGQMVARRFGVRVVIEDLAPALTAIGCYSRQVEAIRTVFPDYGEGHRCKLTLPSILEGDRVSVSQLTVRAPDEYYHADRLGYAVAGTPNRLEYDQGFFVKQGDGAADVKPIAHLYKTQVYALARSLGVPEEVCDRPPTTDTFSMPQTQEEFYFSLPYDKMDLCLYAHDHGVTPEDAAGAVGITPAQVKAVFRDIEAKRRIAVYLHAPPLLVHEVGTKAVT